MNYNIGNFIITDRSSKPAIIISKELDRFLISIDEYKGDYIWIESKNCNSIANLKSEEKLSIVANFDNWFYDAHKLLYQELIIENLSM